MTAKRQPVGLYLRSVYDLLPQDLWNAPVREVLRGLRDELQWLDSSGLDVLIIEDALTVAHSGQPRIDATVALSFFSLQTANLGLVTGTPLVTADPFHVAKRIQTLDNTSRGRAGWLVIAERGQADQDLLNADVTVDKADEQSFAEEFVDVVVKLWDSWEPGSLVTDAASGQYLDPARVHHINHVGTHFAVRGPSLTPTSPQQRPPIFAFAGSGGADRADVLLAYPSDILDVTTQPVWLFTGADALSAEGGADGLANDGLINSGVVIDGSQDYAAARKVIAEIPVRAGVNGRHLRSVLGLPTSHNQYRVTSEPLVEAGSHV